MEEEFLGIQSAEEGVSNETEGSRQGKLGVFGEVGQSSTLKTIRHSATSDNLLSNAANHLTQVSCATFGPASGHYERSIGVRQLFVAIRTNIVSYRIQNLRNLSFGVAFVLLDELLVHRRLLALEFLSDVDTLMNCIVLLLFVLFV